MDSTVRQGKGQGQFENSGVQDKGYWIGRILDREADEECLQCERDV